MKKFSQLMFAAVLLSTFSGTALAATWSTDAGVEIGSSLRAASPGIEPSGLVWHTGLNQLMGVGDEGQLFAMNADGSNVKVWNTTGDLEDIAIVDPSSNYVYLADEDGNIVKFDLSTGKAAQSWSVTTWMPELDCDGISSTTSTCGMEALTYADGYFYAGYQYTGQIFKLDLSGSTASKVTEFKPVSAAISGLNYKDGYLYALYNSTLAVLSLDGTLKTSYTVPNSSQEGVALGVDSNGDGDANMFIAEDGSSYKIYSYDNFAIYGWSSSTSSSSSSSTSSSTTASADPDTDGDGVKDSVDCNKMDASVSTAKTYYVDGDKDGLGSKTTASVCAATAPSGYASNSNDTDDTISNAGIEISNDSNDNDGDGTINEVNSVTGNGYHPYFSTLDPNSSPRGKIIGLWGLKNGGIAVRYADWSVYRYELFPVTTTTITTVSAVSGKGYLNASLGSASMTVNGYTGIAR